MTNEEKILAALEDMKKSQEAFFAEWRVARDEGKALQARLDADGARIRDASVATQKKLAFWFIIACAAFGALFFLR
jgi:hypothetical protein